MYFLLSAYHFGLHSPQIVHLDEGKQFMVSCETPINLSNFPSSHKTDQLVRWHGWLVRKALASHQCDPGSIPICE